MYLTARPVSVAYTSRVRTLMAGQGSGMPSTVPAEGTFVPGGGPAFPSGDQVKIFNGALTHSLVKASDTVLLKVWGSAVRLVRGPVLVLLID